MANVDSNRQTDAVAAQTDGSPSGLEHAEWRLVHHYLNDLCTSGFPLRRGPFPSKRRPPCPADHGSDVSVALPAALADLLQRRGLDHGYGPTSNSMLYCLGGPELYRRPEECDVDNSSCIDLVLNVCDEHKTISVDLYPYDLVPERGGSGPDDPRRSEPIVLDAGSDVVTQVIARVERWLADIVRLPR